MERYCILERRSKFGRESLPYWPDELRIDAFTSYYLRYHTRDKFEESSSILETIKLSEVYDDFGTIIMCQDVIAQVRKCKWYTWDQNLHVYYTKLYFCSEKEEKIWIRHGLSKQVQSELNQKRKDYYHNQKKPNEKPYIPFEIKEEYRKKILISDFAPNMIRFYYLSSEFRNIFKWVENVTNKYNVDNMKKIVSDFKIYSTNMRMEELWLLEQLLGINITCCLYDFFNKIFDNTNICGIRYEEMVSPIIRQILKYPGLYGRCEIISLSKIAYEILSLAYEKSRMFIDSQVSKEEWIITNLSESVLPDVIKAISKEYEDSEITYLQCQKKECNKEETTKDHLRMSDIDGLESEFDENYPYLILANTGQIIFGESKINDELFSNIWKSVLDEIHYPNS